MSVALITGAAGGLGRATAIEFARRGYRLALVDSNGDGLADVAASLADTASCGDEVLAIAGDLADMTFVESCARAAEERFGGVDVLINNAIWRELASMRSISLESWERTLRIGLTAPAFLARAVAAGMEQRRRGVILNVSSIMAVRAGGISPAYVVAKGGLDSLTYELAALYGPSGVRVLSVQPGAIDTPLSRDYSEASGESLDAAMRSWSEDEIPLRRWATPEEIGRVLAILASDDAAYLTGTTITIDGGWLHNHFPGGLQRRMLS